MSCMQVRRDQVRGKNRFPKNILPRLERWTRRWQVSRGHCIGKTQCPIVHDHVYTVLEFLQKSTYLNTYQETARWSVLSGMWGPVYSSWIVNKSQGWGDRELITVIAYILNAGYEVRIVVIELQDVYVSSTFWFPKCFIYVTDNFQWLSEFRPF